MKHLQAKKMSRIDDEFKLFSSRVDELGKQEKKHTEKDAWKYRFSYMKGNSVVPGLVNIKLINLMCSFPVEYSPGIGSITPRDRKLAAS